MSQGLKIQEASFYVGAKDLGASSKGGAKIGGGGRGYNDIPANKSVKKSFAVQLWCGVLDP